MPLSERKKKQILAILDNILSCHSSVFFDHPVDPVRDQLPNYFEIIKNPMDLGTIRSKVEHNKYDNVASFIADVELVWSNAIIFNGRDSPASNAVHYLQAKFKEQTEFLSDDIRKDWINQMNDLKNKISIIISNPPCFISKEIGPTALKSHHSMSSLLSSFSPTSDSIHSSYSTTNLSHSKNRSSSSKNRSSNSSSTSRSRRKFSSNYSDNDDDNESIDSSNQRNDKKSENIYYGFDVEDGYDDDDEADASSKWNKKSSSSRSSNNKSNKKGQSKSSSQKKNSSSHTSSSSKTKKSSSSSVSISKQKTEPDLTEDEIEKLANDVNQLAADDNKNTEIAELLQKMEPQLSFDEEVGVEKLSMPTLKALKQLVNRLMLL